MWIVLLTTIVRYDCCYQTCEVMISYFIDELCEWFYSWARMRVSAHECDNVSGIKNDKSNRQPNGTDIHTKLLKQLKKIMRAHSHSAHNLKYKYNVHQTKQNTIHLCIGIAYFLLYARKYRLLIHFSTLLKWSLNSFMNA